MINFQISNRFMDNNKIFQILISNFVETSTSRTSVPSSFPQITLSLLSERVCVTSFDLASKNENLTSFRKASNFANSLMKWLVGSSIQGLGPPWICSSNSLFSARPSCSGWVWNIFFYFSLINITLSMSQTIFKNNFSNYDWIVLYHLQQKSSTCILG